ncbi:hypothetical protein TcWFU_007147 [Taenia crassiceps]|uniref:Arf-GAP domain-containing protein n=1 Tax=Taenia crassiceps TaxID=6207 RepID=A0ABR4QDV6_9CEST
MSMPRQWEKQQSERLQLIIADLVKDEENKYCADCDAKGVLLCIRCAGIHRGLGVHISKVKSLNLDSWEPQQVAMLKAVGNRRAREIYEANLPEFFRRPQTDSALEQFIRAKYEQKRYVASEFVPPKPDIESVKKDLLRLEQQSKRKTVSVRSINLPIQTSDSSKTQGRTLKSIARSTDDSTGGGTADILGLSSVAGKTSDNEASASEAPPKCADAPLRTSQMSELESGAFSADLVGINFGDVAGPSAVETGTSEEQRATKESILALYALSKPSGPVDRPFSPSLAHLNVQNGTTMASMFGVTASSNHAPNQVPPMYQPPASPITSAQSSIQAPKALASLDLLDLDVFQDGVSQYTSKASTQWTDKLTIATTTSGASPNSVSPGFLQQQWVSSQTAASSTPTLNSSAQQSYLTQIQNQLASMQLRSSAVE